MKTRITHFLQSVRKSFFLKKHTPKESTMELLRTIYPTVDWNRVDFYEGLPYFTPYVAPYVTAQALPKFYSFSRYCIYVRKMDESRAQCIADIVHEGYHILQAMHLWKGYGLGFFRGFMLYYIALFPKHGYRRNPFEITAHDQEYRFLDYCEKHKIHGITPKIPENAFKDISNESDLVFSEYPYRYGGKFFPLVGSFFFCLFIALIKPIADSIVFIAGTVFGKAPVTKQNA